MQLKQLLTASLDRLLAAQPVQPPEGRRPSPYRQPEAFAQWRAAEERHFRVVLSEEGSLIAFELAGLTAHARQAPGDEGEQDLTLRAVELLQKAWMDMALLQSSQLESLQFHLKLIHSRAARL